MGANFTRRKNSSSLKAKGGRSKNHMNGCYSCAVILFLLLSNAHGLLAQTVQISGPYPTFAGSQGTYSYTGTANTGGSWSVTGGTVVSTSVVTGTCGVSQPLNAMKTQTIASPQSPPGGGGGGGSGSYCYNVTISWGFGSSGSVTFKWNGVTQTTLPVQLCPTTTPTPTASFNISNCSAISITQSGTPPANITWYWQTDPNGTSFANNSTSISSSASGNFYLRAYSVCGVWSASQPVNGNNGYVAVSAVPSAPGNFSGNTICSGSSATISASVGSGGDVVRWYTAVSGGTATPGNSYPTGSLTSNTYYYVTSYNSSSGCESSPRTAVMVTVNALPATPGAITASGNTCGPKTLSYFSSPPSGTGWYWQGSTNSNGTDTSPTAAAPTYTITFSSAYYLRARDNNGCWSSGNSVISVNVNPIPPSPNIPVSSGATCGPVTLSYNGTPPTGVAWYWEGTSAAGTDNSSSTATSSTYSASNAGTNTYYIAAQSTSSLCWSAATPVSVTVNPVPGVPSAIITSSNTCGPRTLSYSASPPVGTTWYWQGTNSSGTDTSPTASASTYPVTTSGFYFLRAQINGCWSSGSMGTNVVINAIPSSPGVPQSTGNTCGPVTLSYNGTPPSGVGWYWQGTSAAGQDYTSVQATSSTFSVSTAGTSSYYIAARNTSSGCWSTATPRSVTMNPNSVLPSSLFATNNTCGPKTLSYGGTPPSGTTWYWQGTNPNGTDTSPTASSPTYTGTASGRYYINGLNSYGCWSAGSGSLDITVNTIPSSPGIPVSAGNTCGPVTLSYNGTPSSGVAWYWQGTNASGQDNTSVQATSSTYPASITGTNNYYIAAQNTSSGCWSTATARSVTMNPIPAGPNTITATTNLCGAKTLSYAGAPPSGTGWYWQGTNATGQDYTSPNATAATYSASINGSATYYLASRNTYGCWGSAPSSLPVSTDIPTPPQTQSSPIPQFCEWDAMSITAVPSVGTAKWYSSTNSFLYYANTYYPINLNIGTYTYNVTNVDGNGCESTSVPYSLTVSSNCDQYMNWQETITHSYSSSTDTNGSIASDNKTYSDGFGTAIQSQVLSLANNQVLASESIYDKLGKQTLATLPAPINSSSFAYRYRFATSSTNQKYSWTDFDQPITGSNLAGEVNNPNAVANNGQGTLGWYYSSANTLEPNTPTTSYPYSRTYTPPGPNPVTSKGTGPGDAYKTGGGHETQTARSLIMLSELSTYYNLRPYFNSNLPYQTSATTLFNLHSYSSSNLYPAYGGATKTSYNNFSCTATSSNPGVYPLNGTISVSPGAMYSFQVTAYKSDPGSPFLHVTDGAGNDIAWGPPIPVSGSYTQIAMSFTVPAGVTSIQLGLQWRNPTGNFQFNIDNAVLQMLTPLIGYKTITTDPDGKMAVSFVDVDGHTLASAMATSVSGTPPNQTAVYDNNTWSYNFYNDIGQLVASVAPNGVVIGSTVKPKFLTTYKYDQFGRLVSTKSPDEGVSLFVYSTDGKIRFSQNNEQRTADPNHKRFSYTNYDYLGRLIESGEYTFAAAGDITFDSVDVASKSPNSVLDLADNVGYAGVTRRGHNSTASRYNDTTFIDYDYPTTFPTTDNFVSDGVHVTQNNLLGQVARTKNANATTWYSYDEFGQVEWTVQKITGLTSNKTVDYTYDFLGNVTQVAYQKSLAQPGQAVVEPFFHHYTYNADGKLIDVTTTLDGNVTSQNNPTKVDQAKYKYYLHGPLKRVEFATNLQGIDYVYSINGALKGINHADVNKDPGGDNPSTNGFMKDVFGETLNYFNNDYSGAGYSAGSLSTTPSLTDSYSGQIKSTSWFTPIDNNTSSIKMYGYTYDNLSRFNNAQWGTVAGSSGTYTGTLTTAYNENVGGYDKNGNIMSLLRNGKSGTGVGSYTYTYNYKANTNQLASVTGGANAVNYTYNTIGQMTQQVEGSTTMKVYYNAYGLTKEVRDAGNNLMVGYAYDDRGDRVKQVFYNNGSVSKTTYYVRDVSGNVLAIYEQNGSFPLELVEQPIYGAGRIGMMKWKSGNAKYFYEINDHLGSVRTVLGAPGIDNFTATMEPTPTNAARESKQFVNDVGAPTTIPYASANTTSGGSYVSRLNALANGGVSAHPVGPGIILAVAPGDVISASVNGYYESGSGNGTGNLSASVIASAITSAMTGGIPGDPGTLQSSLTTSYGSTGVFAGELNNTNDNVPHAYLNMIMLDGNLNVDPSLPSVALTFTNPAALTKLPISFSNVQITSPGYVFIWVDVSGNSPNYVYFDDLTVSHGHSYSVAGGDYYPFGLTMNDRQIKDERYRFGYQGQYAEKDSITNWNAFQLRMYDARFGRWLSPDPYAQYASPYTGIGNNPVNGVDPNGGLFGGLLDWFANAAGEVREFATAEAAAAAGYTMRSAEGVVVTAGLDGSRYGLVPTAIKTFEASLGNAFFVGTDKNLYYVDNAMSGRRYYQLGGDKNWRLYFDEARFASDHLADVERMTEHMAMFFGTAVELPLGAMQAAGLMAARTTLNVAKGTSVIGPRSVYRGFAQKIRANFLDVTDEAWTWTKNEKYLEGVVKRGDDVVFAGEFNPGLLDKTSTLAKEINYLKVHGYQWTSDLTRMILR